jgi:hypothetical protein
MLPMRLRSVLALHAVGILLIATGCASVARQRSQAAETADIDRLAALRKGLGDPSQMQGAGYFPYYMHVVAGYVILWRQPPAEWALGEAETQQDVLDNRGVNTAFKRVRMERLPPALRSLPGTRLYLLNERGLVCQASVGELLILGQAFISDPEYWAYQGQDVEGAEDRKRRSASRAELAQAVWKESAAGEDLGRSLGARLASVSGSCDRATWARVAIGPPPAVAIGEEASPAWRRAVRGEFDRLLRTPQGAERFKVTPEKLSQDLDPLLDRIVGVTLFPGKSAAGPLVALNLDAGHEECTNYLYQICVVWAVTGPAEHAQFRFLDGVRCEPSPPLQAAIDIDGDGLPEFLNGAGLSLASTRALSAHGRPALMFLPVVLRGDGCTLPKQWPVHWH